MWFEHLSSTGTFTSTSKIVGTPSIDPTICACSWRIYCWNLCYSFSHCHLGAESSVNFWTACWTTWSPKRTESYTYISQTGRFNTKIYFNQLSYLVLQGCQTNQKFSITVPEMPRTIKIVAAAVIAVVCPVEPTGPGGCGGSQPV